MVGCEIPDDAGVFRINPTTALIQTVDFFTPVVDEPYEFGEIAAVNSLSDVYAMGGKPLTVMNIVGFPGCSLDIEILGEILAGGASKIKEAGAVLVGGHTVDDKEPKYGLSVTGIVHPDEVVTNHKAQSEDILVLTKPLGIGIITTAIKAEMVDSATITEAKHWMKLLNDKAAEAMVQTGVHACTDITGFGLLGHILEMAQGSGVTIEVDTSEVPYLEAAGKLAQMGLIPGGAYSNRQFLQEHVLRKHAISEFLLDILFDPQTSGGLLMAVSQDRYDSLLANLAARGVSHWTIGRVAPKADVPIVLKG